MFSYMCPSCGAAAYSSANASTVAACPQCAGALEPLTRQPLAAAGLVAAKP